MEAGKTNSKKNLKIAVRGTEVLGFTVFSLPRNDG
jgi:hypothetical protein